MTYYCTKEQRITRFSPTLGISQIVTVVFGNSKGLVKLGYPNICAEVKLSLFLFMPALEIVCHETEVLNSVSSG